MNTRKTLQPRVGHPKPPATLLKELPPEQRTQIMEILATHTYQDAAPLVQNLVGFPCTTDVLCRFRKWQEAIQDLDLAHDRIRQIAKFQQGPLRDLPPDQLRDLGSAFYAMTFLARDDVKGFVLASRIALQNERQRLCHQRFELDQLKFEDSKQNKFDLALDEIRKYFDKIPEAERLFLQARELIETAKKG